MNRWRLRLPAPPQLRSRRKGARRPWLPFVWTGLAGFGLAWLVVAFVVFPAEGGASLVEVPSVRGLRYDEAQRRLEAVGLRISLGEMRVSDSVPRSVVLEQHPAGGTRLARGAAIIVDVSGGRRRATVPDVVGLSREAALAALRAARLAGGAVAESASTEPRGMVLASKPDAGRVVPEGSPVDLVLSAGPAELTMPDVVGRSLLDARAMLEQLGLAGGETEYDSTSTLAPGTVLAQTPAAGSPVAPGAVVTLRVSGKP